MKLVIDIPEEIYQRYRKIWQKRRGSIPESCIAFGTPLPKGRGRLIDEKILLRKLRSRNFGFNLPTWVKVAIDDTPTIIEADKEET